MKIDLDKDSSIEVKADPEQRLNLVFKTKKDSKTTIVLNAKLDAEQLDQLITYLVSLKIKVR